jgi:hypothetical protein
VPQAPQIRARPGRDARREFEYVRHGTISVIAAMNVATGEVIAERIEKTTPPPSWRCCTR